MELIKDPDQDRARRAMEAKMIKIDIAALERATDGHKQPECCLTPMKSFEDVMWKALYAAGPGRRALVAVHVSPWAGPLSLGRR